MCINRKTIETQIYESLKQYKLKNFYNFCKILNLSYKNKKRDVLLNDLTTFLVKDLEMLTENLKKIDVELIDEQFMSSSSEIVHFKNNPIEKNKKGYWNISSLFRADKIKRFNDWYVAKSTKLFLNYIAHHLGQPVDSLISKPDPGQMKTKDIFAHKYVALDAAAYISPELRAWMFHIVLNHLDSQESLPFASIGEDQIKSLPLYQALTNELEITKRKYEGLKQKKQVTKFEGSFCYYSIWIRNRLKAGITQNVNNRLASYRTLCYDFRIQSIYHFNTEKDMIDFEVLMKIALRDYKITGESEQYGNGITYDINKEMCESNLKIFKFDYKEESLVNIQNYNERIKEFSSDKDENDICI
jgi:hypothetical protein